jgi:hypothetical protein
MNGIQKLLGYVVAFAIAVFVMPADAASPTKKFSIDMSPSLVAAGDTTLFATIKNETPNGNSSINSLKLSLPSGYQLRGVPTIAPYPGQVTPSSTAGLATATQVTVSNMSPLKPLQSFVITLPVTVTASTCQSSSWTAQAWTGSSFSGDEFKQVYTPPDTQFVVNSATIVGSNQSLTFVTSPTNATLGQAIPVAVKVNACGTGVSGTPVMITVSNCTTASGCLTGNTTINSDANGVANFSIKVNQPGTYQLTASASGYPPISASFTVYEGTLNCGDNLDSSFANPNNVAPDQPGYSTGFRGAYNKDGTQCVLVPYTFTNTILTDDTVHLSWDASVQASPAFMYSLNWRPHLVESASPDSGWTLAPRPQVAWLTDGSGNPIYVPGLACLSGKLPSPYGTLQTAISDSATTITVTGIHANKADPALTTQYSVPMVGAPSLPTDQNGSILPFPIVIGATPGSPTSAATERMTALSVVPGSQTPSTTASYTGTYTITFNVRRGTVTEGGATPVGHAAGSQVMSTPLPIIPNDSVSFPANKPYVIGKQANMCIAEHGFDAFTLDANANTQVMYFTTVIDIGDGWVLGR